MTVNPVIGVRPDISAVFADRMVAPTRNIVALPVGTPAEAGSLVEPLAVGHHAMQRADLTGDARVLVVGGGPIGQAAALAARRLGGASVVVAELDTVRRDLLTRLGFDTVDPATHRSTTSRRCWEVGRPSWPTRRHLPHPADRVRYLRDGRALQLTVQSTSRCEGPRSLEELWAIYRLHPVHAGLRLPARVCG